jgi:asparagine synthase (glutamine-hydrolysing)
VPLGAFLSGGLDSSMIVAAMREIGGPDHEIRTFSVGFSGDPHSELPFAGVVAERFGALHTPITVGPEAYIARLAELSACRDGPVSQPADVAIAEMSRVARRSVKVALSGEGSDEIFAGYPKHAFANAPWALRAAARIMPTKFGAQLAGMAGMDRRRALVALRALGAPRELDSLVQWFSYFGRDDLRELLPGLGWSDEEMERTISAQAQALSEHPGESRLFRMQTTDFATWLPGNMLERGDRMTMAEGLEVRPPFLDKDLIAFGLALPDRLKIKGREGKWMVREWGREMLPAEIIDRPKWGFRVPLAQWFRRPLRDMLYGYLTSQEGLIARYGNRAAVAALLDDHDSGRVDSAEALWTLLTAEVWYQDVYMARLKRRTAIAA